MTSRLMTVLCSGVVAGVVALAAPANAAGPCEAAAETKKITVMASWIPNLYDSGPLWVAKLAGYYKDEGIEVEIIAPANPADPIKLVARNRVQLSETYVPEVMISRDTGIPVVAVATTLRELESGLMSLAETAIDQPSALKGKTLGIGPKLDAQAFLDTVLTTGGLTRKDVKIVDPGFGHIPYTLEKKVDATHALLNFEVVLGNEILKKQGKPVLRFMPYTSAGVPKFHYQLLVANEQWAKKNANTVCRFLRASMRGVKDYGKHEQAALDYIIKANNIMTPEEHKIISGAAQAGWTGKDGTIFRMDPNYWKAAQEWALKYKIITLGADVASYFTNNYIPKN
ncbi:MAG: hypothetical protein EXQ91_01670 [Alphaproteobacteria bacterium]|nr:hypothetical protein [Alphaproteobacteria bacterium]